MVEKKANLSLNKILNEIDFLIEKKIQILQGDVENLSFPAKKKLFKKKPNSDANQTLSNERNFIKCKKKKHSVI